MGDYIVLQEVKKKKNSVTPSKFLLKPRILKINSRDRAHGMLKITT